MAKLIITRGLPASGKTTAARGWIAGDPTQRARVGRDPLRLMLHDRYLGNRAQEQQVTLVQRAAVTALLNAGIDVIVDDTNLHQRYANELRTLAETASAEFEVWDFTYVDLEECIRRDAARTEGRVGEKVIRDMHRRYLADGTHPLPMPRSAAKA